MKVPGRAGGRADGWGGRTVPHHSSARSFLPLCQDLGLSLCVFLPEPPLHCKQPTQFWVLRWWRNCPPLPIWPFQSLTGRTGGKKYTTFGPAKIENWLESGCEKGMYIVVVIRPGRPEMRLTLRQTLRCFLSLLYFILSFLFLLKFNMMH